MAAVSVGVRPYEPGSQPGLRPVILLRETGFDVHLLFRGEASERTEVDGVPLWVEPDMVRLAARMLLLRPQLLFVEANANGVALAPLAARSWIRNPAPAASPRVRALQQAIVRRADAVTFTNPALGREWASDGRRRVDLAYPVDLEWWSSPVDRQSSWWASRGRAVPAGPVLVCNSAYVRGKRVVELLEMLVPFLRQNPSSVLVCVGHQYADPETAEKLMQRPGELGLESQVLVTGRIPRDELRTLLAWADVSIINSARETQCMAIYESLAAGVPTLIAAVPTLTSQFPSLPAHEDEAQLLSNLERVLGDSQFAQGLIESTRERVAVADPARHDQTFLSALDTLRLRPTPTRTSGLSA
jgi:glycosyltransferase involved in cell wall biosynthesis